MWRVFAQQTAKRVAPLGGALCAAASRTALRSRALPAAASFPSFSTAPRLVTRMGALYGVRSGAAAAMARVTGARSLVTSSVLRGAAATTQKEAAASVADAVAHVDKPMALWLGGVAALTFGMVVLGGVTRLTESGLSMTHWKFLGGMPPRTLEEWEAEFERYKTFPEYEVVHRDMDVHGFKRIFFFEYTHRMLGRLIGAAYLLPLVYFAARGRIRGQFRTALPGILGMIVGQGLLGWYMVKSGLDEELIDGVPRVSQYRLAAHLGSAFVIYSALVWAALAHIRPRPDARFVAALPPAFRTLAMGAAGLVGLTALSGAFVAGLDAGLVYNEFPLMGGRVVPDDIAAFTPMWRNLFENPTTVQFNHRVLGISTVAMIALLFRAGRKLDAQPPPFLRKSLTGFLHMSLMQAVLGISTLLTFVPTPLAATHQAGSLTLITFATMILHELKRVK